MVDTGIINLARKWRVQAFEDLVGQSLVVRMLKNSLYANILHPVYLFVGQHGSGKTSSARIFAAAVNCDKLDFFRQNPKDVLIPCYSCDSCQAMAKSAHPDFIEIDAASYTGVDHVRGIIEAASLMPVLGQKRIYLIDEAHMLSKAAFNALLKILEEPPKTVMFMLATTDPEKIIETVKSRCFQLFFSPIPADHMMNYLQKICQKEGLNASKEGLSIIVHHAKGSVRDALNLIERARFASTNIGKTEVLELLGIIDDAILVDFLRCMWSESTDQMLTMLNMHAFEKSNIVYIWNRLQQILRLLLWTKYRVVPESPDVDMVELSALAHHISLVDAYGFNALLYQHEYVFHRTANPYPFFELVILDYMHKRSGSLVSDPLCYPLKEGIMAQAPKPEAPVVHQNVPPQKQVLAIDPLPRQASEIDSYREMWDLFCGRVRELNDRLLDTIFKQAELEFVKVDSGLKVICHFAAQKIFFDDMLSEHQKKWKPLFVEVFGARAVIERIYDCAPVELVLSERSVKDSVDLDQNNAEKKSQKRESSEYGVRPAGVIRKEKIVSSDELSKLTNVALVLSHFPGTVTRVDAAQEE